MIAALKNQYGEKVRFVHVVVNDSDPTTRELLQKYEIYSIPAYLFFDRQGEMIGQFAGYLDPVDLAEKIAALTK